LKENPPDNKEKNVRDCSTCHFVYAYMMAKSNSPLLAYKKQFILLCGQLKYFFIFCQDSSPLPKIFVISSNMQKNRKFKVTKRLDRIDGTGQIVPGFFVIP
jgi:hypothetical protein